MAKRRYKKPITVPVKVKKPWEVSKGHQEHRSGAGNHDNRPKRLRTRNAQKRKALKEYD